MRRLLFTAVLLVAALFLLPVLWPKDISHESAEGAAETAAVSENETVTVQIDGKPTELTLESYVEGVTAAEIPADFPREALRAQAVAARTYALCKLSRGRPDAHPEADLCDDYRHCAAYRSPAVSVFGTDEISAIRAAVRDTEGEILTSEGAPIAAVFHCVSGPRTESAADVWGEDVPYLQSVTSPEGDGVPDYESQVTFSSQEFKDKFSAAQPDAVFGDDPAAWVTDTQRTAGGSVHSVTIGGVTVTGAQARTIFGLRSATFTLTYADGTFTFSVTGFGHGVGMSQYGADAMAEEGKTYSEILQHYYTGVTVEECPAEFFKN